MDDDRKYKQRGYMDSDAQPRRDDRPRHQGPKPPIDITGPRLPRMVENVTASRCFNCATPLMPGTDFKTNCPKCSSPLHCCKQCTHFEPSTRFQCLKPIPARLPYKDQANECEFFSARVTVARDVSPSGNGARPATVNFQAPTKPSEARAAFDNLFKK
ncbi:MAG: hypothetical protein FJW40_05305 [Acidobacteria bacterium]|nr:hypothetical protein [Acidobacteriota bacterium]